MTSASAAEADATGMIVIDAQVTNATAIIFSLDCFPV